MKILHLLFASVAGSETSGVFQFKRDTNGNIELCVDSGEWKAGSLAELIEEIKRNPEGE